MIRLTGRYKQNMLIGQVFYFLIGTINLIGDILTKCGLTKVFFLISIKLYL